MKRPPGRKRTIIRLIVILIFAMLVAVPVWIAAPHILNQIFLWIAPIVRRNPPDPSETYRGADSIASIIPLAVLGGMVGAWLGSKVFRGLERTSDRWDQMANGDKVTLFLGIFMGVVISLPF